MEILYGLIVAMIVVLIGIGLNLKEIARELERHNIREANKDLQNQKKKP